MIKDVVNILGTPSRSSSDLPSLAPRSRFNPRFCKVHFDKFGEIIKVGGSAPIGTVRTARYQDGQTITKGNFVTFVHSCEAQKKRNALEQKKDGRGSGKGKGKIPTYNNIAYKEVVHDLPGLQTALHVQEAQQNQQRQPRMKKRGAVRF